MKLEVGKTYWTRDREHQATITGFLPRETYPYRGQCKTLANLNQSSTWLADGDYSIKGKMKQWDLVEKVQKEQSIISFALGLLIGHKGVRWFTHVIYLALIVGAFYIGRFG